MSIHVHVYILDESKKYKNANDPFLDLFSTFVSESARPLLGPLEA